MQPQVSRRALQLALLAALVGIGAALWSNVSAEWRKRDEHDVRKITGAHGVVVFVAEWCGYCKRLEAWLAANAVPYRALDVEQSEAAAYGQAAVVGRNAGVPTTVIGSDVFQGLATEPLRERLVQAGYTMRGNP